jgi:acyl-CoA synthetase (AMP-forming)/AMP-acid ligase II
VLSTCEGIVDVAVCSLPNQLGIGEICALVAAQGPLDVAKIKAQCAVHMLPQFVPAHFIGVDNIPRNEMGKIDRTRVQEIARRDTVTRL